MKKIYIDGLGLVDGHFSGVGQYILGILRGLDELQDAAKYRNHVLPEVYVIIPRDSGAKFNEFAFKHIKFKKFPLSFRHMSALWHRGWLPPIDLWCGKGSYIFPRFVDMPLLFSKSAGLVVFDLSYEHYRQFSDEGNAIFLSKGVKRSIKNVDKVITISKSARNEVMDFYKLKKSDVVVATPAVDPKLFYRRSNREIEEVKCKYGITGNYILALSNLEPRKNLGALVEAYCRLPKEVTDKIGLLLVGVSGWKTDELFADIVSRVGAGYNIMRPSKYVLDEDKPALLSGAEMLVYPSHYEGFGMPPLEALSCGTPVITSDNSSLPEAIGDAGFSVSSTDTDALLEKIKYCLENIEEITKESIIKGPKQADKFSWTRSAQIFMDVVQGSEK